MGLIHIPFRSGVRDYEKQAASLLDLARVGDEQAISIAHGKAPADFEAAKVALARWYSFRDWPALADFAEGPVRPFEAAAEAVIQGDIETLDPLLKANAGLAGERSTRVTKFDPPVHGATLLHYVAANGVEHHRQKTPPNAVAVARTLLEQGAPVDALAGMYGRRHTVLDMLVSSSPPAAAGVQVALVDLLADFGADVQTPLQIAVAHGFLDSAEALIRRGARVETLECAAGLGRVADAERLLADAPAKSRHRALALAAQHGHTTTVRLLLEEGEDPNRYNPEGAHPHSTPLHQAALAGHEGVVRLLIERGARLDWEDKFFHSTPKGWALHNGHAALADLL